MNTKIQSEKPNQKILSFDIGIINLAYCYGEKSSVEKENKKSFTIIKWDRVNLQKCHYSNCSDSIRYKNETFPIFSCKKHKNILRERIRNKKIDPENIIIIFDLLFGELDIDIVLIENQYANSSGNMKQIQNYIHIYFLIKKNCKVYCCHARNKLGFNKEIKTYKKRKLLSIKNAEEYLNFIKDFKNLEKFSISNKKDDLADCLLQVLFFCKNNIT